MKTFTPFPLVSYPWKILGFFLFLISSLLTLLLYFSPSAQAWLSYPVDQQLEAVGWGIGLGMFAMASSKEKIDDERIAQVRSASYRMTFAIFSLSVFYWGAQNIREQGSTNFDPLLLFVSYLGTYLLVYYIGLLRDPVGYYGTQDGGENWRNDRWVRILALALGLCMVGILVVSKWQ
ncbi:MAG: hypothetical protein AAFR59_08570 [Bacteroidota bacterium]